jgi:23S rRNA (guanosine2251-2'-O)-methyltransferase
MDPSSDSPASRPQADEGVLEGAVSVLAALRAGNREVRAMYLRRDKEPEETATLERMARERDVPCQRVDADFIEELVSGRRHGGVIAVVGPRRFVALEQLLPADRAPFVVMIDGVEDPYNFGQAVRSLYAAGTDGLVVRPRNWLSAAGVVARSSAGASELIPTAVAETALEAADFFRSRGLAVACAAARDAVSLYAADLTVPLFLLVGGEQRGITRSFLRQADLRLEIPYARRDARSLGTVAATAIIAFEVMRQRSGAMNREP